jgi:hypothetical protein
MDKIIGLIYNQNAFRKVGQYETALRVFARRR